ncbi:hypothetical protein BTN50_1066 [Candidatus Enterovibrio altilux]|uniref:Uncharacterized protein n=1 Tax=Candidatus Enterovibrio altilux TaxID=1927128 RepID=A0A291B997_9GAMM|nr:hypothetical protein BTN50_1066 [Candidatus Enterovibrio luxaltus]
MNNFFSLKQIDNVYAIHYLIFTKHIVRNIKNFAGINKIKSTTSTFYSEDFILFLTYPSMHYFCRLHWMDRINK